MKKEELQKKLEEKLNDFAQSFVFRKAMFNPQRSLIFILIGNDNDIISYEKKLSIEEYLITAQGYVHCIKFNDSNETEQLYADFKKTINNIAELRLVEVAKKISIIPLFIQSETFNAEKISKICVSLNSVIKSIGGYLTSVDVTDILWWPTVVLKNNEARYHKDIVSSVCQWSNRINVGYINNVLVLKDWDSNNLAVTDSVVVHSLFLTLLFLSKDSSLVEIRRRIGENGIFTSRAITVGIPIHIELFSRVKSLIKWFLESPNEDVHIDGLKNFGSELTKCPQKLWWGSTWDKLPINDKKQISIEPIRSFSFPIDINRVDVLKEIEFFQDKYYKSNLPIKNEYLLNDDILMQFSVDFWSLYMGFYGYYCKGISDIFENGNQEQFINSYIGDLPVCSGIKGDNITGNRDFSNVDLTEIENKLEFDLKNRVRDVYSIILNAESKFFKSIQNKYYIMQKTISDFLDMLNCNINTWKSEEMSNVQECCWNTQHRIDMMKNYVDIFNYDGNDEPTQEKIQLFFDKVFSIVRDSFDFDSKRYFKKLSEIFSNDDINKNLQWEHLCNGRDSYLLQSFECDNTIIVMCGSEYIDTFKNIEEFSNYQNNFVYHLVPVEALSDRLEIIKISSPIDYKTIFKNISEI